METNHAFEAAKAQIESICELVKQFEDKSSPFYGHSDKITEDAYSVEVRSGWVEPGAKMEASEFQIILAGGGPSVRIFGDIDQHGQPIDPILQFQDWGTPWTVFPLTEDEEAALQTYCEQFYFGE